MNEICLNQVSYWSSCPKGLFYVFFKYKYKLVQSHRLLWGIKSDKMYRPIRVVVFSFMYKQNWPINIMTNQYHLKFHLYLKKKWTSIYKTDTYNIYLKYVLKCMYSYVAESNGCVAFIWTSIDECEQWGLWRDCAVAQSRLSSRCSHAW